MVGKRILLSLALFMMPATARANLLSDAWGILTDPLKLDASSENVIKAVEIASLNADRIEGKVDRDLQDRLDQLGGIIRETRQGIDKTVGQSLDHIDQITSSALQKIDSIQRDIFKSSADLVKCSTEVSSELVQEKIASSLNSLGARRPRIVVFGIPILEVKFDKSDFPSPIEAFRQFKKYVDNRLADLKPTDSAYTITDLYGEMQRNADLTMCHYNADTATFIQLYEYQLEYIRRGRPWIGATALD
jgi:hypothetical protein